MKKLTLSLIATCLLLTFQPLQSTFATTATSSSIIVNTNNAEAKEAEAFMLRLNEIDAMDKSNLNSSEKSNLRTEVGSISQKLRGYGGGVYLSAGAIIIIILLLIILL